MREISILKQKILDYLDKKNISKYECYKKTGITNGVLSQSNGLSEENLLRFLYYYNDINLNWFFNNEGEILKSDEEPPPTPQNGKADLYYNMYKEEHNEVRALTEEIGALKERLRQYQSQIETFQDLPSIRSDSANNTGNQKKYISKKDVTAPNATKELVKNASKHDSKISAATSVAVNSTKQQSGTKKKV